MVKTASIYLIFLLFALAYALLTPPGEAPDEMPHLQYVDFLLHEKRLPHRFRDNVYQDHHPPLYYAAAALTLKLGQILDPATAFRIPGPFAVHIDLSEPALDREKLKRGAQAIPRNLEEELTAKANLKPRHFTITRGQFLMVRLLSVLLALGTLFSVHGTVRLLLPSSEKTVRSALLFAALLPQFQFMGSMINCDIMAIFTGNLLLYLLVRSLIHGTTTLPLTSFALGLALALCLLSKMSAIAMVVPVVLAYGFAGRVTGYRRAVISLSAALLLALALGGWWYAMNACRFGDPFMVAAQAATMGEQIHQPPLNMHFFAAYLYNTVRSFFGHLGPFSIPIADWSFYVYMGFLGLALCGLWLRRGKTPHLTLPPGSTAAAAVLTASLFATWIVVFRGNLTFYSFQGRYLFPGLAAVAAALGIGLEEAIRPGRVLRFLAGLLLLLICIDVLTSRFLPEYYPLRNRVDRPLVLHYENAGHPHLSHALRAGTPTQAWGGFGTRHDPAMTTARGSRVAFLFDRMPLGEPLQVRLRFGEYFMQEKPWAFPVQSLHLGTTEVAGALMAPPWNREMVFPVPDIRSLKDELPLEIRLIGGSGPAATVSEIWVELFPLKPTGLIVPGGCIERGKSIKVGATVQNRHPSDTIGFLLGFCLESGEKSTRLGKPEALCLEAGKSLTHTETLTIPADSAPGKAMLRAYLAARSNSPFLDINPCVTTPSVGKIRPDPEAFSRYAVVSVFPEEKGNHRLIRERSRGEMVLKLRIPFPPALQGQYHLVVHARIASAGGDLAVSVLNEGRRYATHRPEPNALNPGAKGWSDIALNLDWPGGPGEIHLDGKGEVRVDRIRLVPIWVPGINLIPFPHESATRLK